MTGKLRTSLPIFALLLTLLLAVVSCAPQGTVTVTVPSGSYPNSYGPGGMMGPGGWMGSGGMGPGMMGGQWWQYDGSRINLDNALNAVQNYLAQRGDANLQIDEIMEFEYNFYVEVKEKDTGIGAFEVLVDPYNSAIYPEPGPNVMWNTKYGTMSGMMWGLPSPTSPMTVSAAQAQSLAQAFLDNSQSGSTVGGPSRFYGYYTFDTVKDEKTFGMLSVNGFTGQVWYHSWHGRFIGERELK